MRKILSVILLLCGLAAYAGEPFISSYLKGTVENYELVYDLRAHLELIMQKRGDFKKVFPPMSCSTFISPEKADFLSALSKAVPNLTWVQQKAFLSAHLVDDDNIRNGRNHLEPLTELPSGMEEFTLFLQGYREMKTSGKSDVVPEAWKKLLDLPLEQRRYRTLWVYNELRHYNTLRKLADSGLFIDTPELAKKSYYREIDNSKDYENNIHVIYEGFLRDALYADYELKKSIDGIIWRRAGNEVRNLLKKDELTRELLAPFLAEKKGYHNNEQFFSYYDVLKDLTFIFPENVAFGMYQNKDYEEAESFLSRCSEKTLLYYWLKAKLALKRNDDDAALKYLQHWLYLKASLPESDQEHSLLSYYIPNDDYGTHRNIKYDMFAQTGLLYIKQRNFTEALHCFYLARQWVDMVIIAEQYMDLQTLKDYVDSFPYDEKEKEDDTYWFDYFRYSDNEFSVHALRHLFARRAFREGQMDWAMNYQYSKIQGILKKYLNELQRSENEAQDQDTRAIALYNAAKLMYYKGMDLCGMENFPDFHCYNGKRGLKEPYKTCKSCKYNPLSKTYRCCPEHGEKHTGISTRESRFTYRYIASEMALKAGELAKDKELRALIHYAGGVWICKRAPQEADVFYKRMVNRSRGTELSKLSDRLHWFPSPGNAPEKPRYIQRFFYDLTQKISWNIVSPPQKQPEYPNLDLLFAEVQNMEPLNSLNDVHTLMKNSFNKTPRNKTP